MTTVVTEAVVDPDVASAVLTPRDGVIAETPAGTEPARFALAGGPVASYERCVCTEPVAGGRIRVRQEVTFTVGLGPWSWLFFWPMRQDLGRLGRPRQIPWWGPPQLIDRRGAVNLAALSALTVVIGYLDSLVAQTMTYVGGEYGVGTTGQGIALGVVQVSAVVAVAALMVADRRGRRRLVLGCAAFGVLLSAAGALSPSLEFLTGTQVLANGLVGAGYLLIVVVAAEEMPAGSRAWATGLVSLCYGLGSGGTLIALPLADLSAGGWRWLYAIALAGLPVVAGCGRYLGESRRFVADTGGTALPAPDPAGLPLAGSDPALPTPRHRTLRSLGAIHRRRLVLLGAAALLSALFATPAGQFQNQFLRTERHFSAANISALSQVAGTIGALAVLVGGRLADTRGRRPVAAAGIAAGTAVTLASYFAHSWALWLWTIAGSLMAYGVGPALAVYGPELFPAGVRSRASGVLGVLAAAGAVVGLLAAAGLSDLTGSIGTALAVLAIGPAVVVVLIVVAYPETAGQSLETLNPEDAPPLRRTTR